MSKQHAVQKGVGVTGLKPAPSVSKSVAKIPSKTVATSPNSHKRGKQG